MGEQGDKIKFWKPGTDVKKVNEVDLLSSDYILTGIDEKNKIVARMNKGNRMRVVKLVERTANNYEEHLQNYVNNWRIFKKAGLPVVPSLRQTTDGAILVTDVTYDGSYLIGKSRGEEIDLIGESEWVKEKPSAEEEKIYIFFKTEWEELIRKQASELAMKATEYNLILPIDDPFEILVKASGDPRLIILDLSAGGKSTLPKEKIADGNKNLVEQMMQILKRLELKYLLKANSWKYKRKKI